MRLDLGQIEVVDERVAAVLRRKSGAERLRIASGLFRAAREIILSRLRQDHADWTAEQIESECARRVSHGIR